VTAEIAGAATAARAETTAADHAAIAAHGETGATAARAVASALPIGRQSDRRTDLPIGLWNALWNGL